MKTVLSYEDRPFLKICKFVTNVNNLHIPIIVSCVEEKYLNLDSHYQEEVIIDQLLRSFRILVLITALTYFFMSLEIFK